MTNLERAVLAEMVRLNTPITKDDAPYPASLMPIVRAVIEVVTVQPGHSMNATLVDKVARVLLDTADVHDLGWNNLRTTAAALLPLFAEVRAEGFREGREDTLHGLPCGHLDSDGCECDPPRSADGRPYRCPLGCVNCYYPRCECECHA